LLNTLDATDITKLLKWINSALVWYCFQSDGANTKDVLSSCFRSV